MWSPGVLLWEGRVTYVQIIKRSVGRNTTTQKEQRRKKTLERTLTLVKTACQTTVRRHLGRKGRIMPYKNGKNREDLLMLKRQNRVSKQPDLRRVFFRYEVCGLTDCGCLTVRGNKKVKLRKALSQGGHRHFCRTEAGQSKKIQHPPGRVKRRNYGPNWKRCGGENRTEKTRFYWQNKTDQNRKTKSTKTIGQEKVTISSTNARRTKRNSAGGGVPQGEQRGGVALEGKGHP